MLLEVRKIPNPRKHGTQFKVVYVVKCDTCGVVVEKFPSHAQKSEHFCGLRCANEAQKPGGILDLKKQRIFQERFGVDNPFQAEEVKATCRQTALERYGVEYPQSTDVVKERVRLTCQSRYGVDSAFQHSAAREKARQTYQERYGVDNPNQSSFIRKKAIATARNQPLVKHWKTGEELYAQSGYEYATLLWLNAQQLDFDWQVPFTTPFLTPKLRRPSTYIIDLFIKSGTYSNTYVEVKGVWNEKSAPLSRAKWEWFHHVHANSQLWTRWELEHLGILKHGRLHPSLVIQQLS